eukprot:CAMPEP_0176456390 /NCGR_PEP_ID=MMETSP0127-20121128/31256_1 /TAXON_ID=938130 /ORGANISM="Platyophrya macrostoma, Strain WH" /LENGTH=57 /DNA_ID=CAMNT_0017846333 /DNA_START=36 /DNA_END=206 /DNA_ORIENTATION=+
MELEFDFLITENQKYNILEELEIVTKENFDSFYWPQMEEDFLSERATPSRDMKNGVI